MHLQQFVDTGDYVELTGERRGRKQVGSRTLRHRCHGSTRMSIPLTWPSATRFTGLSGNTGALQSFPGVKRAVENTVTHIPDGPPYPIEDAAVHHVFDGGWMWLLHFNNGVTSAGVAATEAMAQRASASLKGSPHGAVCWSGFHRSQRNLPMRRSSSPSSICLNWPFAARRSLVTGGRSCRRQQASSIPCSQLVSL